MSNKTTGTATKTKRISLTGVMAALVAVTTTLAIPLPPPLSTVNFAPVIIFVTSILLGPSAGAISAVIGCAIGYLAGTTVGTILVPAGFLYVYMIGLVLARGPMAFVVGVLRKYNELVSMIVGVIIETFIFFAIDFYLFGIEVAVFDLGTFVDFVFIPVTLGVLVVVRRFLGTKHP